MIDYIAQSGTNEDVDHLRDLVRSSGADTVVTVDAFWMGTRLIRTKEVLDAAISDIVCFASPTIGAVKI